MTIQPLDMACLQCLAEAGEACRDVYGPPGACHERRMAAAKAAQARLDKALDDFGMPPRRRDRTAPLREAIAASEAPRAAAAVALEDLERRVQALEARAARPPARRIDRALLVDALATAAHVRTDEAANAERRGHTDAEAQLRRDVDDLRAACAAVGEMEGDSVDILTVPR